MNTEGRFKDIRILVVDDDPDVLELFSMALTSEGAIVTTADDGDEAISLMMTSKPQVVVLDMMLPRRSGLLVFERIQEESDPPAVLMVTANEGRRHKAYAENLGVGAYLIKPVAMERLFDTVESLL